MIINLKVFYRDNESQQTRGERQQYYQMTTGVRLLTFNVFLRPPPIKTNQDDYKEERFQQILKVIDDYDIVCFQEMFQTGTFRPERIIQEAIKKKFYYWKVSEPPSFLPGPVVDSGLMVLSRFPISYNIGILSDSASDKGYIYCKINAKGQTIHLFVTHLQASYKLPGKQLQRQLSVKTRLYQFDILLERIKHHIKKNDYKQHELVLLVGDLNVDSNETPFRMSQDSCLKKTAKKMSKTEKVQNKTQTQINISAQEYPREDQAFKEFRQIEALFQEHRLEIIDHGHQRHEGHPVTFGDGDVVLTGREDITSYQSLDYIFSLRPQGTKPQTKLKCLTESCKVEKFKYPNTVFGQLSDHYGISIVIN